MLTADSSPCAHCEHLPRDGSSLLCLRCKSMAGIRRLYLRRRGWTPSWDAHLEALSQKAKLSQPLFPS
ncbi:MAG: hypothetical protein ACKO16_11095 [Gemmataceae bacterium]